VFQLRDSPHLIEARSLQKLLGVERGIPLGQIEDGEVKRAVGGGVQGGRNPLLILEFAFDQAVSGGAVGDDIGFADDARGRHTERLKNTLLQKVAVELASDLMDENTQREIAE